MQTLLAHLRTLWPRGFILPVLPFVGWALFSFARGERRWEHLLLLIVVPILAYTNAKTKKLLIGIYPILLVGLLYDAMRFVKNWGLTESRVHVCDLHDFDARFFGVTQGGHRLALPDFTARYDSIALDIFFSIPYGIFIYVIIAYAVFLFIRDFVAMQRFAWSFFLLNLVGYVTYHIVPAAPPWYFHSHGCVVDLLAKASEGPKLARVDELLGVGYFRGFYGRASDVYGAIPSLHVAYPLLIVLEGWRRHSAFGRTLAILFFISMCCAAVYLDHHWVTDIVVGITYCLMIYALVRAYFAPRADHPIRSQRNRLPIEPVDID